MSTTTLTNVQESGIPEFVDAKGARRLFGLSRAHLYELIKAGEVRSCCIRRPGAFRGRRLFCCRSLREFLTAHMEELP
jgi:hypothetical protein